MTSIVISIVIFRDIAIPKSIVRSTLPVSSKTGIEKYRPSLEVLCGNLTVMTSPKIVLLMKLSIARY